MWARRAFFGLAVLHVADALRSTTEEQEAVAKALNAVEESHPEADRASIQVSTSGHFVKNVPLGSSSHAQEHDTVAPASRSGVSGTRHNASSSPPIEETGRRNDSPSAVQKGAAAQQQTPELITGPNITTMAVEEHDQKDMQKLTAQAAVKSQADDAIAKQKAEKRKKEAEAKTRIVMRRLEKALETQDLDSWSNDLKAIDVLLKEADPNLIDINKPPGASSTLAGEKLGKGAGGADSLTYLGRAAGMGWLPGLKALVEWDKARTDTIAPRLKLEDGGRDHETGATISPLTLAAENSRASVVRYLLRQRASVMVPDQSGRTPLELAAAAGDADVIEALLTQGSALTYGLADLRHQVAQEAEKSLQLEQRWPFGSGNQSVLNSMRKRVSDFGIAPSGTEKADVGDLPADWIVLYKSRIMHAFATSPNLGSEDSMMAELVLSAHLYDSFAREFSLSVVMLSTILGIFGLFLYVIFRLRLFGGSEVPVSLAHMVPGTFDPTRIADPDFDPSRRPQSLPYRAIRSEMLQVSPSLGKAGSVFLKAVLGVFLSWGFLAVRIPPVQEAFDEDFLSDDDDTSRAKVCEQCSDRARFTHKLEVFIRCSTAFVVFWWLCTQSHRWLEAALLILMYSLYSLIASSARPADALEDPSQAASADDKAEAVSDSEGMVYALFDVQHGPKWVRAVCSTRSTATTKKVKPNQRQRRKRGGRSNKDELGNQEDANSGAGHADSPERKNSGDSDVVQHIDMGDDTGKFFSTWQHSFLTSGVMHIPHSSYLEMSVSSMVSIGFTLLWLAHLRILATGCFHSFYAALSPSQLFGVYGAPGSGVRGFVLLFELALLLLVGERLHSITGLVHAAALTLQQRQRALAFLNDHSPPARTQQAEPAMLVKEIHTYIDQCVQCGEMSSQLSALRWAVLRSPVLLICAIDVFLLAIASTSLVCKCLEITSDSLSPQLHGYIAPFLHTWTLDPAVPLGIALCLTWPLTIMLVAAALSNGEVFEIRSRVRREVSEMLELAAVGEIDDVQHVAIKVKAEGIMIDSMICWPGGRELSLCEPSLLLAIAALACGLAVVTSTVLPGALGNVQQAF